MARLLLRLVFQHWDRSRLNESGPGARRYSVQGQAECVIARYMERAFGQGSLVRPLTGALSYKS